MYLVSELGKSCVFTEGITCYLMRIDSHSAPGILPAALLKLPKISSLKVNAGFKHNPLPRFLRVSLAKSSKPFRTTLCVHALPCSSPLKTIAGTTITL